MQFLKPSSLAIFFAAALLACSPNGEAGAVSGQASGDQGAAAQADEAQAERHPLSGLQVIDLSVSTDAATHAFRVELADTSEAQARGLMFRTELGDDEGMLFPSQVPQVRSFWMRNTPISLDIIFIGTDSRIMNIAANTEPYSLESVRSSGLASAVLELRAGRSAELGIEPGDLVEYRLP